MDYPNILKQVPFGNSFAFLVTSNSLRAYLAQRVVEWILPFSEVFPPNGILSYEFPLTQPRDGLIETCFDWIRRYTYIQHNYMLFAFTIENDAVIDKVKVWRYLKKKCIVFIDKVHQQFYLVNYKFSDEVFKGTLLDGVLLQDRARYEALTPKFHPKDVVSVPYKLRRTYKIIVENTDFNNDELKNNNEIKDVIGTGENENCGTSVDSSVEDECDLNSSESMDCNSKPVVSDPLEMLENFRKVTQKIDYSSIFQQASQAPKFVFYIQAVYALHGENIEYSLEKLMNAISYKACLKLQTHLLGNKNYYVPDDCLESAILKGAVDTMYYTRHTKILLKNPFSNDYLRYQPQIFPVKDKRGSLIPENATFDEWIKRDVFHFFPLFDEFGNRFDETYVLDRYVIKCEVQKTKDVYVYKLVSNDKRFDSTINRGYAKIWTYEGTRYLRVLFHKIHIAYRKPRRGAARERTSQKEDLPMYMYCIGVKHKSDGVYIGWTPIMYTKN